MQLTGVRHWRPLASLKRRDLLLGIGTTAFLAGSGIGVEALLADPGSGAPPAAFLETSRFVTGSALSDEAAIARAWSQLVALDAGFPQAVGRLNAAVHGAGLRNMAEYMASPLAKDADLFKTATTIVSAFYLGYTGTFVDHSVKDDTGFVTFAGALMWRPTIDATVIPTYSRGGTDFWIDPPEGTPTPKGAASVSQWQGSTPASHSPQKA
ncbi:sugar dehydrogenase complex small subunit [Sphingomonas abietis]|uniref:Sugar dehydrogenase complex small subunit n=1 Tax=Sphingomonas abietis TaxID=3012344 RepID=A0ABY7NTV4_9SPHN|nr:sugar dehydrogenase complex small subunit [Sphingomonas abietis]WBO23992.1 sugar dehydrogenase complex small subunit [Sphingomonas abietis]